MKTNLNELQKESQDLNTLVKSIQVVEETPKMPEDTPVIEKEATNETAEANDPLPTVPDIAKEVTNETVDEAKVPVIAKEVTNEKIEEPKKEVVMKKEVTDEHVEKAPVREKKEVKEGYTDEDIADIKYTPRKDDNIDSKNGKEKGPRSPLPGG